MKEKAKDLVYLDTYRYISLEDIKLIFVAALILPISMIVLGGASIYYNGLCWKSLFPIVSIFIWSLIYWVFVLSIESKYVRNTFELRFIVNGIIGVLLSSLFILFFSSIILVGDGFSSKTGLIFWAIALYLLFSIIYIVSVVLCVHKGVFATLKKKMQTKKFIMVSKFFGALIPVSGLIGIFISRITRDNTEAGASDEVITVLFFVLMILLSLTHINFVQYYYCKKYGITCDENGGTTSPRLDYALLREQKKKKKDKKRAKRKAKLSKIPRWVKIIVCIICAPFVLFLAVFIVLFLIEIVKELVQML